MNIVCLDAEFADNEELLELSMFDLNGKEIYHRYYRPEKISTWRTDIHHITPEMVAEEKPFSTMREEVQGLLDDAYALTGFAVDNDLRVLTHHGITGLSDKLVIDVKDMFWYMRGRESDMNPFAVPSLISCAGSLGLDFDENSAHSASADTDATLKCFNILFSEFMGDGEQSEISIARFIDEINDAKAKFVEECARGYVKVSRFKEFHKVYFGRSYDGSEKDILLSVPVNDRYKAEYDIRKMLKKKEIPDKRNIYKLTPKLMDEIKNYKNEYDADDSAWCKKVLRNLSRLSL